MSAGVLAYRLCDREYDCDRCPLDAALRGITLGTVAEDSDEAGFQFPCDRRYHAGHGWIRFDDDGSALFGVDAVAARLLAPTGSIVLPPEGTELRAGGAACWVREDGDLIPVKAPISGLVLAANAEVQQDPALLLRSPYDRGWLLRLRYAGTPSRLPGLFDGTEAARRAGDIVTRIRDRAMSELTDAALPGATLADGGETVRGLRRMLGPERYARLISELLR
jgi:glycine cleavage system H protein